ncbi:S-methyl-5-thioribose-1-phosphate isomerase [Parasporobacterium paucivorans]|uniref:Methylthioribose-1-phosphate isomerase n=1 Tax=Parasporobacterium paucivorans DSM 15970 TaxID=1122934 RepID=A0A1M6J7V2_9FIRM|nr:S-methyl-5-thioribose-1-phosphate isomerase [Parasporobacterium paucivorans]SHJ42778.1 methylthioribose-1-phosphate isomerase [Parasporobacterium paucivorans DSM 15970]
MDTIRWEEGKLKIIDQTKLPTEEIILDIENIEDCRRAIKNLQVRGAPAIGDAAAFGMVLGLKEIQAENFEDFYEAFLENKRFLSSSRPTAVNLFWALDRMEDVVLKNAEMTLPEIRCLLEKEAMNIAEEDAATCRKIGENGAALLRDGMSILTHCNAGRLATARYGTALAPVYVAEEQGKRIHVYADETRPLLQGARLTAYELKEAGVDVTVITDSMAAYVMKNMRVDFVIVGCDRVAANGDTANKIGTYGVALLAKAHGIPFYVAGPFSTIDMDTPTGREILIEERPPEEITHGFGKRTVPVGVEVLNPAFDVTDHALITGFITEKGIICPPYKEGFEAALRGMKRGNERC